MATESISEAPLLIQYTVFNQERQLSDINLLEANNYSQSCVESTANVFRFTLEVPDPNPENSYSNNRGMTQMSQIVSCGLQYHV